MEYLLDRFDELSDDYLDNNCRKIEEYERYGDTYACVGAYYTDGDIKDSYQHALEYIKEEIAEALKVISDKCNETITISVPSNDNIKQKLFIKYEK